MKCSAVRGIKFLFLETGVVRLHSTELVAVTVEQHNLRYSKLDFQADMEE
jgi:hypothetical protein